MLKEVETWVIDTLQTIFDQFGWLGVAGMMLFENATGITPSEVILGMAGWFLVSRHDLPLSFIFQGGLYAAIGSAAGASLTYWVSRVGGRPIVEKVALWARVPVHHISRAEEQFQRWGPGLVLFGRLIPGIRTLVSIPAGLARMPYVRFLIATFAGAYVWCTFLIGIGYWLGEEWEHIGVLFEKYAMPVVVAVLLMAGLFWWIKRYGKKNPLAFVREKILD